MNFPEFLKQIEIIDQLFVRGIAVLDIRQISIYSFVLMLPCKVSHQPVCHIILLLVDIQGNSRSQGLLLVQ